jgi:hypothetical protein
VKLGCCIKDPDRSGATGPPTQKDAVQTVQTKQCVHTTQLLCEIPHCQIATADKCAGTPTGVDDRPH